MSQVQYQFRKLRPKREQPQGDLQATLLMLLVFVGIFCLPLFVSFFSKLPSDEVTPTARLLVVYIVLFGLFALIGPIIGCGVDMRMNIQKMKTALFGHKEPSNHLLSREIPVLLPQAWEVIREGLNGLPIKMPDKRLAYWRVEQVTEQRREAKATISYMADPLGRKMRDLYTRTVSMKLRLQGTGVRTKLEIQLEASSPMDDLAVHQLCESTADALAQMCINAREGESRGRDDKSAAVAALAACREDTACATGADGAAILSTPADGALLTTSADDAALPSGDLSDYYKFHEANC